MVDKKDILQVFDSVISNIEVKCHPTIAEMHETLNSMSYDEQFQQLTDKGLLNPLEEKDFRNRVEMLEEMNITDESSDYFKRLYEENLDELFGYGRRLIEGLKYNEPPVVDIKQFKHDKLSLTDRWEKNDKLESAQIKAQQEKLPVSTETDKITDEYGYTYERYLDKNLVAMNNYFNGDCQGINYNIKNLNYLNRLEKETQKSIKNIDALMDKSPGLLQDTILYRGGYWDIHLKVGDHSKGFKGYQSTSFLENTAKEYKAEYKEQTGDDGMLIRVLAPKGTKGIVGNDNRFENGFVEHEYTLPRNTGFTVVDIDYDKMVATVILDS